jgi:sugar O-acyltransferase (sialic acid O-acetyltransferase NeuD family)
MKAIIGAGGWARVVSSLTAIDIFYVDDQYSEGLKLSSLPKDFEVIIAIASPWVRKRIYLDHSFNKYLSYIHPTSISYDQSIINWREIFIAPYCVFTTNISIGVQAQINIQTIIGHDVRIGDFFTTSPGVFIGGNVTIGNNVHIGAHALLREKISICDDVLIGMGSVVTKDINKSGVYFGNPARRIKDVE